MKETWRILRRTGDDYVFYRSTPPYVMVIDIADFWGGDGAIGLRLARAVQW